jgi:hypothetical protein
MDQKYEFLTKNFFIQKWIFIIVFGRISLIFNLFTKILVKLLPKKFKKFLKILKLQRNLSN